MAAAAAAVLVIAILLLAGVGARRAASTGAAPEFPSSPASRFAVHVGPHGSAVTGGASYSVLGIQMRGGIAGSGVSLPSDQEFAVVKVRVRNAFAVPVRASVGHVALAAGPRDYQPRIDVAARLQTTHWQALYLRRLAPGAVAHVKVFFVVPTTLSSAAALRVGSHGPGSHASLIPLFLP